MFKFFKFLSTSKFVMAILFVMITISFVLFGMGDIFNLSGKGNGVASVGKTEISYPDFQERYKRYLKQYNIETMPVEQQRALGLGNRVVSDMLGELIIENEVKKLGLQVSDTSLASSIRNNPMFKDDKTGAFNRIQYENLLRSNGLSESSYAKILGKDIINRQLVGSLNNLFGNTPALSKRLQQIRGEKRDVDFIALTKNDVGDIAPVSEDDLKNYFEENKTLYTLPATRHIDFVILKPNNYMDDIAVSSVDMQAYYDANRLQFGTPEKRSFNQYLFDSKEMAQSAYDTLVAGDTLEGIEATQQPHMSQESLGDTPLAKAVFKGGEGSITQPIESDFGWIVAQITKVTPPDVKPLSEVKTQIKESITKDMALDSLYSDVDKIDGSFTSGASLAEVAKGMNLPLYTFKGLTADGKKLDGGDVSDFTGDNAFLALEPKFLQSINQLMVGETGIAVELPNNIFFVASLVDTTEPRTPQLAEVKSRVMADLENTRKANALDEKVKTVVAQLETGAPLANFGTVATETGLTRGSQPQNRALNYLTIKPIFATDMGKIVTVPTEGSTLVIKITAITPAAPATEQEQAQNNQILAEALSQDMIDAYDRILKDTHGVRINQFIIDKIYQTK